VQAGHGEGDLLEELSYRWEGEFIVIEVEGEVIGTVHKAQLAGAQTPNTSSDTSRGIFLGWFVSSRCGLSGPMP
jgi:hypothetical protein